MRAVAFDFDGTLTCIDTTRLLLAALSNGRRHRLVHIISDVFRFWTNRLSLEELQIVTAAKLLRGRPINSLRSAVRQFVGHARPLLRNDTMAQLREHVRAGDSVVVATALPAFVLAPLFESENVVIVGSRFEVRDGCYTGRCLGSCSPRSKQTWLEEWLKAQDLDGLAYAYTDDPIADGPMLELAKNQVVVPAKIEDRRSKIGDRR